MPSKPLPPWLKPVWVRKPDHGLVELHPLRGLGAVGGDRTLGTLGRDRAGAVGEQEAEQDLIGQQLARAGAAPGQRQAGQLGGAPAAQDLVVGNAAEPAGRGGRPGTEAPIRLP